MIFTSIKFLLFFFSAVIIYFSLPKKFRWVWLLICSLFFYLCAGVRYSVYLLATTATTYSASLWMEYRELKCSRYIKENKPVPSVRKQLKKKTASTNKLIFAICLLVNLGTLAFLKYFNFALGAFGIVLSKFGISFSAVELNLILPLGISFYTFQSIAYLTDVYRGVAEAQKNPLKLLLFFCFFPCILQGPINRYNDLAPQLFKGHSFCYDRVTRGLQRMLWGFFEKLVIADRLGIAVDKVFGDVGAYNGAELCVTMVLYAIQIYADFQGYMDIACGAAEAYGIKIAENFDSPYLSRSVPEFWRRWHITLGGWFRDYLYYPVMRSRLFCMLRSKPKSKPVSHACDRLLTVAALFIVWTLTGLWHGANYTYIAWGFYYGVLIAASTVFSPLFDKIVDIAKWRRDTFAYRVLQIIKTFIIVCAGYIFFRSDSLEQARQIFNIIINSARPSTLFTLQLPNLGLDYKDFNVIILAVVILFIVDICRTKKIVLRDKIAVQPLWFRWSVWLIGFSAVVIFGIYGPSYDASSFIYFNF